MPGLTSRQANSIGDHKHVREQILDPDTGVKVLALQIVDLGLLNFDDFDEDRYAILGSFDADTIIVRMFQVPLVAWDFDTFEDLRNLSFGTAVGGDPANNGQTMTEYPAPEDVPAYQGTFVEPVSYIAARENGSKIAVSGYVDGDGSFWASYYNGGAPLTTGQSHVYAIIATPA